MHATIFGSRAVAGVKGCTSMIASMRLLPIAAFTVLLTACGGGGYSSPAVSTAAGGAGTTVPASAASSPLSVARGTSKEVDAFAGTTPYSYNITSSNALCATGTAATPANASAYGVAVGVPAAAVAGCTATLSVSFVLLGSATPVLVDSIFVMAT
jgi:hypothetical protein